MMLRTLFFAMLTFSLLKSEEVSNRLTLLGQDFIMATESYDLYASKGKVMRLYQRVQKEERKYLLTFILHDETGGCGEKSIEDGSYEVNGPQITLYTLWDRQGSADAPFGARMQQYIIDENGTFELLSSKIYIETEPKSEAKESAMQYLFHTPVTTSQKEALQKYVESAQQYYKGIFVFGQEAQSLIKDVKEALHRKMQKRWH